MEGRIAICNRKYIPRCRNNTYGGNNDMVVVVAATARQFTVATQYRLIRVEIPQRQIVVCRFVAVEAADDMQVGPHQKRRSRMFGVGVGAIKAMRRFVGACGHPYSPGG